MSAEKPAASRRRSIGSAHCSRTLPHPPCAVRRKAYCPGDGRLLGESVAVAAARARPPIRRRGDDVVRRAPVAGARPPRRRRVRAPGDRGQAGAAGRQRRLGRSGRGAAVRSCDAGDVRARHQPRRRRPCRHAMLRVPPRGGPRRCGSVPGRRPRTRGADHVSGPTTTRRSPQPGAARRAPGAAVPRAVGADPRVLRAPRAARPAEPACDGRGLHHLLRRGPARRRSSTAPKHGHGAVRTAVASRRSTPRSSAPSRPGDLVLVHAGTAIASSRRPMMPSATDFLYPVHRGRRARRGRAARRPRALGRGQGRGERRAAVADARPGLGRRIDGRGRRRWRDRFAARRPAVHVRQRRQLHRCGVAGRAVRPTAVGPAAAAPAASSTTPRCSPRSATTSASTWSSRRQLIAHAGARRHRGRAVDQRQLAQPAATRSPRRRAGAADHRASPATTGGEMAASPRRRSLPRRARPTACTGSRRRRPRSASHCGERCRRTARAGSAASTEPSTRRARRSRSRGARSHRGVPPPPAPADRRRRHARPRRRRQGVGRAGRRRVPRGVRRRQTAARSPTRRRSTCPTGERLAFTTDSFVVQPRRFPGGSIGHLAVHGTVNDLAVLGRRADVAVGGVRDRRGLRDRRAARDRRRHGRGRGASAGVTIVTGDTKVVGKGAADGLYITTAGVGVDPGGATSRAASRCSPATSCSLSGTIADHGMAVMLARGDLLLEADIRSDTAPLGGLVESACSPQRRRRAGCATRPAAAWRRSATSSPATPTSASCSTRRCCRSRRQWSVPATCWASIRCTSPTRASSSRSSPPTRPTPRWRRCASHPLGLDAARIGEIVAEPAGHRRAAHQLRRHPHRRHARRRPAPAHLLTP